MNARERVLSAMRRQPVDHVPCAPFMNFQPEDQRWGRRWQYPFGPSERECLAYMMNELGVDQVLERGIGYHPEPGVSARVQIEGDIIRKTWCTPAGELRAAVHCDEHWIPGFDIPFFHDYNPSHFVEPWIKTMQDVECLRHILLPPSGTDALERIRFQFRAASKLAGRFNVALSVSCGMGLTGAVLMFGPSEIAALSITNPNLVDAYLEVEHHYNLKIMELAIDQGADIIRRNGFYESCDLFSPGILERFLSRRLRCEADLVHSAGKLFAYTMLSGYEPVLDMLASAGIDSLMCPDIFLQNGNGEELCERMGENVSFWTGPSDTVHMPYERPEEVRKAVRRVFDVFGKTGLILTPCSSSKAVFPWANVLAMVDEWKKLR